MQDETFQPHKEPEKTQPDTGTRKKKKLFLIIPVLFFILGATYIFFSRQDQPGNTVLPTPSILPSPTIEISETDYVADQIIVRYKSNVSNEQIEEILNRFDATIIKRLDAINRTLIKVPDGRGEAVLQELLKNELVESAERDYINSVNFSPNDASYNMQWALNNTGQTVEGRSGTINADINADIAWDVSKGQGVRVAVIDTGVDTGHPDLSSKIAATKIFNGDSINDLYGHGTHVAGIIGAVTNNLQGVAGVCPDCQLVIAKALDDSGKGPDSVWIEALLWAADQNVKVINISFGSSSNSTAKQDAVNYAWNKGIVVVSSSGNSGNTQQMYPCANTNVLCVSASDNRDQKSSFSNYGTWVDIAAPGSRILSTFPRNTSVLQQQKNQSTTYGYLDGTSMATPVAAGVAGLVFASQYGSSANEVVKRITDYADRIQGTGQYWAYGRINAAGALGAGQSVTPTMSPTNMPTSTTAPTTTPIITPTPTSYYVTPTIYCLGAQECISRTPTLPPTATPKISYAATATPIILPSKSGTQLTVTPRVSRSVTKAPTNGGTGKPANNDLITSFIELIMKLISAILLMFQKLFQP